MQIIACEVCVILFQVTGEFVPYTFVGEEVGCWPSRTQVDYLIFADMIVAARIAVPDSLSATRG